MSFSGWFSGVNFSRQSPMGDSFTYDRGTITSFGAVISRMSTIQLLIKVVVKSIYNN
ncbi:MAG: hypothetical protein FWC22_05685 [Treponema sp.]|nr:hypothetical protein [Treponema sp.]